MGQLYIGKDNNMKNYSRDQILDQRENFTEKLPASIGQAG